MLGATAASAIAGKLFKKKKKTVSMPKHTLLLYLRNMKFISIHFCANTDSYQHHQVQAMWQKLWSPNRLRERGPLKSWKPESMAEALLSVLKDGLSLSQAARKYDIPYPTFVLYANRVHAMLGPSIDGDVEVRPKGRGRPQRILLGIWPDDHIKGVVKSVVFREAKEFRDETVHLGYNRDMV